VAASAEVGHHEESVEVALVARRPRSVPPTAGRLLGTLAVVVSVTSGEGHSNVIRQRVTFARQTIN